MRDTLGLGGLAALTAGAWLEFGPGWAAMIAGTILLTLAVAAAVRSAR
jgi:hypothetical protein